MTNSIGFDSILFFGVIIAKCRPAPKERNDTRCAGNIEICAREATRLSQSFLFSPASLLPVARVVLAHECVVSTGCDLQQASMPCVFVHRNTGQFALLTPTTGSSGLLYDVSEEQTLMPPQKSKKGLSSVRPSPGIWGLCVVTL